jgi:hypothetical protein
LTSRKTKSAADTVASLNAIVKGAAPGYQENSERFLANLFAIWAAQQAISFRSFTTSTWSVIARYIPSSKGRDGLGTLDIPRYTVEQYHSLKQGIIRKIRLARDHYMAGIPFLSAYIDLYQNSVTSQKYVAVSISWVLNGQLHTPNLAIRDYSPSYNERNTEAASELLKKWSLKVFADFKISDDDLFGGAFDAGSDVKKASGLMELMAEWCCGHLLNRALIDSFGADIDKRKSKNLEARAVVSACRKVIEMLNKSGAMKKLFEEKQMEELKPIGGKPLKIKNAPQHRWSAITDAFEGLLLLWTQLASSFRDTGKHFIIHSMKQKSSLSFTP